MQLGMIGLGRMGDNMVRRRQPKKHQCVIFERSPAEKKDAYERGLTDTMAGDATLFVHEDYVAEAWPIVAPALKAGTPVYAYEPGNWSPAEVDKFVAPPGGWNNPVVTPNPVAK